MYHHTKSLAKATQVDEQTIAQTDLNAYIEQQAQAIAPEPEIQFIDLDGFYNYEAQLAGEVIATITHDCEGFVTQPWIVMVGEVEVHRADTWAKCADYIRWHYKQGTLPKLRAISPEELLDKPFEQLTCVEWQLLKQYEPESDCFIAA
ncbi:hypothetical protein G7B40_024805 [Aetokthonos hydrillicola Thurmond2011]|jgi:hypothetical protein|uniref:Uncharacterized protein n=1 Tax=Aetokthonos hydrillicola Thurmond2011 TaxID=2712845 RepID=A0AAP5ID13_9CYAN|nr:hypothetical protein [Aetokthonos hydrillicola]MBO3464427.1 hypothetical protein [Aetokthonos hydrillicola CCALA 1050]MBW4586155.1 hypothetical protein [Aetokthonos hydrillicola CCALA 1050]MDR9897762.1 hypothetical protein [Aetokthonos hydrillicola Thurmond2011]